MNNELSICRGADAQLDGIRAALMAPSDQSREALLPAALEAYGGTTTTTNNNNNPVLHQGPAKLSWHTMGTDNEENGSNTVVPAVEGYLFVTHEGCLFVGSSGTSAQPTDDDWFVPATALTLHALAEQEGTVYVQMENNNNNGSDDDDNTLIEWTITVDDVQALYQALTDLVTAWPIDPHEDTNNINEDDDDNFEPEDMIWASDIVDKDENNDPEEPQEATEEERQAMLDRLDQVLTVPPELEIKDTNTTTEGQFDDAEEEDEINNLL
jgi:hypothetical protein